MRPYRRILSLDGGGSWALIQACALGEIYGHGTPGREVLNRFDLVIANSGGSLVAGALLANRTPRQIVEELFLDKSKRQAIFATRCFAWFTRWIDLGPRYRTPAKLEGLREIVNNISPGLADAPLDQLASTVSDALPDLVFTSFDYDRQRAVYLRSWTGSRANSDPTAVPSAMPLTSRTGSRANSDPTAAPPAMPLTPTLAEAIHGSTNAPVNYFSKPARFRSTHYAQRRFWDGGVAGLNNPVLAGVIEAIANGSSPRDLRVVSVGTGSVMLPIETDKVHPPLAMAPSRSWLKVDIVKLAKAILGDPPDAASYIAYRVLHGSADDGQHLIRLNPLIQPIPSGGGYWKYPPTLKKGYPEDSSRRSAFEQLVRLDIDAVSQADVELIRRFCDLWIGGAILNQPVQSRDDFSCGIGHRTFAEAKTAVLALPP